MCEKRRLGYYILKIDGTMDACVSKPALSEEILQQLNTSMGTVFALQPVLRAYEVVDLSHRDVHTSLAGIEEVFFQLAAGPRGGIPMLTDAHSRMLQRVMAFLSSVRSFLDHTTVHLRRQHGEASQEFSAFKAMTGDLFESHFSYRFLDKLRNMAQHVAFPISVVNLSMTSSGTHEGLRAQVNLTLDRDRLLSD